MNKNGNTWSQSKKKNYLCRVKGILYIFLFLLILVPRFTFSIERPPLLIPPVNSIGTMNYSSTDSKSNSKKSQIPTSWGGSALIQETKPVNGFPMTTYSLAGGAWILHRKVRISSPHIEVVGEDAYLGFLKGGVRVEDKENRITFTANKGTYDKFQEQIVLEGRPTLEYYNPQNKKTKVTAPYIKRYLNENKTVLEGGVILEDADFTILCDKATFFEKEGNFILDDYPLIFGDKLYLTGEKVVYNNETKTTTLENNTVLVRLSYETKSVNTPDTLKKKKEPEKSEEKELEEKKRTITLFTGERLESKNKTETEEAKLGMYGDARIFRDDFEYQGNHIIAFGDGYKNLEAKEYVVFWDKENKVKISGKLFEHKDEEMYTHVTEDPVVEFLNDDGTVSSTMTTIELERFGDKREIVARGNVEIQSESSIVRGQYATYFEETKKLIVEGNPTLERNGNIVRSGRIIIFPEDNRMLLSDGLDTQDKKKGKP